MASTRSAEITRLLRAWTQGDQEALNRITPRTAFFRRTEREETAEVLKISPQCEMHDWRRAKAFLMRELSKANIKS